MVAYNLTNPLEFVGYGSGLTGLQVVKARNKDDPNPSSRSFTPITTINISGSPAPTNYTELKVFNGIVTANALPGLMADLRDRNLWVNRDGYCYIRIPGSNSSNPRRPAKFMRLNDLFNWKDYVDVPGTQTFTPTPSTTVWNRHDSSSGVTQVDYEKLDSDLKQAKDDKKKAEDNLKNTKDHLEKKAEEELEKAKTEYEDKLNTIKKEYEVKLRKTKSEYEDKLRKIKTENEETLQEVRKQKKEMDEWMERLKENWANAARVGARPLPPSAFYVRSNNYRPEDPNFPLSVTWMGKMEKRISDPGSYMGSIGTGSIKVNKYGNESFETHFWWVVQMDGPVEGVYGIIIAFDGTGRYPSPTDQFKFQRIFIENWNTGVLDLPGIGWRNLIILRHATRGTYTFEYPRN